jgi:hypothetical protein
MLDLTKKNLYDNQKKEMNDFLSLVLVTKKERNEILDSVEDTEEIDEDEITSKPLEDYLFGEGYTEKQEEIENKKDEVTLFSPEEKLGTPYETGEWWKDILFSPYFLFYYIFRGLSARFSEKKNLHTFLNSLVRVSAVTSIISLLLVFLTDARFLFSLEIQAFVSVSMFIISGVIVYLIKYPGILDSFRDPKLIEEDEDFFTFDEPDESEGLIVISNTYEEPRLIIDADAENENEDEVSYSDYLEDDVEIIVEDEEEEESESYEMELLAPPIPHSPLEVNQSIDDFLNDLKQIYHRNKKYEGVEIDNRKDLVLSLSDYLIANDKSFGSWNDVKERGTTYNNIMYTLYLAFKNMNNKISSMTDENTRIYVNDMKENPLMYKVEIELPDYFNSAMLNSKSYVIEAHLKETDSDTDVNVVVSSYRQGYVIKLFKPVAGLVSLGDILRYQSDSLRSNEIQAYEHFMGEKMGLPIVIGLKGNEFPLVVDLAENTSAVIVGESGSGKSWGTFLVMVNLILSNSYNDLNIVILDRKKSVFWREFARLPHVLGYHTDVPDYFDILKELKEEMEYRKQILSSADKENWKGLRDVLIKQKKFDEVKAFPWLVIIMDETTNTMAEVEAIDADVFKSFQADLATLAQEGRSLGIKLIMIGQRAITQSIPRNNMANSSMKLFFKVIEGDYSRGFTDYKNLKLPQQVGQALLQDFNTTAPVLLRTLSVGGKNDDQIVNLIRTLAFEWTRRSLGNVLTPPKFLQFTCNRDAIREVVLKDMEEDNMFLSGESSSEKIENLSKMIKEGFDISTKIPSTLGKTLVIEKEDSNGNLIPSYNVRDVVITLEDDEIEPEVLEDVLTKDDDLNTEITTLETNVVVEKSSDFEDNVIISPRNTGKKIVTQTMKKKTLVETGKIETVGDLEKTDRMSALDKLKKARAEMLNREMVEKEKSVKEVIKPEVKIPIPLYIQHYGEGGNIKKVRKVDIEGIYSSDEIKKALDSLQIVKNGEYYQS